MLSRNKANKNAQMPKKVHDQRGKTAGKTRTRARLRISHLSQPHNKGPKTENPSVNFATRHHRTTSWSFCAMKHSSSKDMTEDRGSSLTGPSRAVSPSGAQPAINRARRITNQHRTKRHKSTLSLLRCTTPGARAQRAVVRQGNKTRPLWRMMSAANHPIS